MSKADRIGIMERRRALEAARNMLYSKIGKVSMSDNYQETDNINCVVCMNKYEGSQSKRVNV